MMTGLGAISRTKSQMMAYMASHSPGESKSAATATVPARVIDVRR